VPDSEYKPRNEVRFAVVMYGGVSLAIYINGVAQELFRLVRATAPNADRDGLAVADRDLNGVEAVYREIGRRRGGNGTWIDGELGDEPPTPTRFVVDILTGTSAGGINGILLGKALANGRADIDALKKLWIEEGQIELLLNESAAYDGIDGISYTTPPGSLLAGDRLLARAKEAISGIGPRPDGAPNYVDELDLTITMTDLQGLWEPLQLTDAKVWEPQHRADLKFVYATELATGSYRNDFEEMDDALAFAARATSSFPFAFAPVTLREVTATPNPREKALFGKWNEVGAEFEKFAFADGGYLQNKPIAHATSALKRRRANAPVERKLIYVEPDPGPLPDLAGLALAKDPPDAVGNVGAAMVGLPQKQPIRDDIDEIRERNAAIARIDDAKRRIMPAVLAGGVELDDAEPTARPYLHLRRSDVIDALTDTVLRATNTPSEGTTAAAVRLAFAAHAAEFDVDLRGYLGRLDLRFRLRRLTYVEDHIESLLENGDGPSAAGLLNLKETVNDRYVALRAAGRGVRTRITDGASAVDVYSEALVEAVGPWLSGVPESSDDVAAEIWDDADVRSSVAGIVDAVETAIAPHLTDDSAAALDGHPELREIFDHAEAIDSVIYPMTWPALDETRHVDIHRISPYDATSLIAMPRPDVEPPDRQRLAGVSLGHFGGFLDETWRRNDMLWGRLDGAERLVAVLVPDPAARERFRIRVQAEILRDEFDGDDGDDLLTLIDSALRGEFVAALDGADDQLLDLFVKAYLGPAKLDRAQEAALLTSSSRVAGIVLGEGPRPYVRPFGRFIRVAGGIAGAGLRVRERIRRLFGRK
jgi:predicted acylesterase/phospholipase RssA